VVPGVDELRAHHRRVRPPPIAVPLPGRHPRPSRSPTHTLPGSVPVVVLNSVWSVYYNRLGWASCRSASLG
jgi:hypothetical protein